ncbi:MAG: AAA family ATPase, partial [Mariprofundus sp.]
MYLEHFGLNDLPFTIAPNPRYLYLTHQHQEALAHLTYGLGSAGGVVLLTGEVGTGKTTISRKLLEDIPEHIEIAWIVNPRLSAEELLASICDELSICYPADNKSIKMFTDLINAYLIEAYGQGRDVVLMIDEAQNLSPEVLEQLRLLTNLETSERKLLQIILLGQPELKELLERTDLRQLSQRITARFHLNTLKQAECREYIRHRLAVAGCNRPVFSNRAMDYIFHAAGGTPRLINLLCDRALLGAYSCNEMIVSPEHVQQASKEVFGDEAVQITKQHLLLPIVMVIALVITSTILLYKLGPWLSGEPNSNPTVAGQITSLNLDKNKPVQFQLKPESNVVSESETRHDTLQSTETTTHQKALESVKTEPDSMTENTLQDSSVLDEEQQATVSEPV